MAKTCKTKSEAEITDSIARQTPMCERQRMALEPGRHYRGSFWINEFGEISVQPEQKGKNPCGLEKLTQGDNWVVYTSKNVVRVVVSLPRLEARELKRLFTCAASNVLASIIRYNLTKV
ncbi:MAG: hypothetical protein KBT12_07880 [Bacteroidales bacterium]|nr:hypothetical protein [Candidatus Physcousia equi]